MDLGLLFSQALFWLAAITLLGVSAMVVEGILGQRKIGRLNEISPLEGSDLPRVSVVIAARNEERNIEEALSSLLAQDYPNIEFIVTDDRSCDATGKILDRLAAADTRLQVRHVTELPTGWLGKNHALHCGAESARGEYLLFTDADVVMERSVISRAMRYLREQEIDHLAIGPKVTVEGFWVNVFVSGFVVFFGLFVRPWKVRDPKSSCHVGIGAFNLIGAQTYLAIGGHRAIAMRPDDDLKLGKLVKKHGFRQDLMASGGLLSVEWYSSVRELVNGLMKNSFAGLDYNLAAVAGAALGQLVFFVWPFVAAVATDGWTQLLNCLTAAILLGLSVGTSRANNLKPLYGLGLPVAALMFTYILLRSTALTLARDGIDWRGTHYSLKELKANKV